MQKLDLKVSLREIGTKSAVKILRKTEKIPAILYGKSLDPVALTVDGRELTRILKSGENVILNLAVTGGKKDSVHTVIIRDIQHDPVKETIDHLDFVSINLDEKIEVKVHLTSKGECPGVAAGGILEFIHHEVPVRCLPLEIPEKIVIDVSNLNIGRSLHVSEVTFPQGVECLLDPHEPLIAVHAPQEEEVKEEDAAAKPAEPEVIGKKEKDAEAAVEKEVKK